MNNETLYQKKERPCARSSIYCKIRIYIPLSHWNLLIRPFRTMTFLQKFNSFARFIYLVRKTVHIGIIARWLKIVKSMRRMKSSTEPRRSIHWHRLTSRIELPSPKCCPRDAQRSSTARYTATFPWEYFDSWPRTDITSIVSNNQCKLFQYKRDSGIHWL